MTFLFQEFKFLKTVADTEFVTRAGTARGGHAVATPYRKLLASSFVVNDGIVCEQGCHVQSPMCVDRLNNLAATNN